MHCTHTRTCWYARTVRTQKKIVRQASQATKNGKRSLLCLAINQEPRISVVLVLDWNTHTLYHWAHNTFCYRAAQWQWLKAFLIAAAMKWIHVLIGKPEQIPGGHLTSSGSSKHETKHIFLSKKWNTKCYVVWKNIYVQSVFGLHCRYLMMRERLGCLCKCVFDLDGSLLLLSI